MSKRSSIVADLLAFERELYSTLPGNETVTKIVVRTMLWFVFFVAVYQLVTTVL